jgi:hypothetical protein
MLSQNFSGHVIAGLPVLRQPQESVRSGPRTQSGVASRGHLLRRRVQSSYLISALIIATTIGVILLGCLPTALAQSAADHAAQAHGRPITQGHPVQPRPDVVEERWKHHEQSLKVKQAQPTNPRTNGNSDPE